MPAARPASCPRPSRKRPCTPLNGGCPIRLMRGKDCRCSHGRFRRGGSRRRRPGIFGAAAPALPLAGTRPRLPHTCCRPAAASAFPLPCLHAGSAGPVAGGLASACLRHDAARSQAMLELSDTVRYKREDQENLCLRTRNVLQDPYLDGVLRSANRRAASPRSATGPAKPGAGAHAW